MYSSILSLVPGLNKKARMREQAAVVKLFLLGAEYIEEALMKVTEPSYLVLYFKSSDYVKPLTPNKAESPSLVNHSPVHTTFTSQRSASPATVLRYTPRIPIVLPTKHAQSTLLPDTLRVITRLPRKNMSLHFTVDFRTVIESCLLLTPLVVASYIYRNIPSYNGFRSWTFMGMSIPPLSYRTNSYCHRNPNFDRSYCGVLDIYFFIFFCIRYNSITLHSCTTFLTRNKLTLSCVHRRQAPLLAN